MSKRAADTEPTVQAPPLRAPECRRDKQRVIVFRGEQADMTTYAMVSKKLAYDIGLAKEWKASKLLDDAAASDHKDWITLCRLSCASYQVQNPAAALAALHPTLPDPCLDTDRVPSKQERQLPLASIVMVYDH